MIRSLGSIVLAGCCSLFPPLRLGTWEDLSFVDNYNSSSAESLVLCWFSVLLVPRFWSAEISRSWRQQMSRMIIFSHEYVDMATLNISQLV